MAIISDVMNGIIHRMQGTENVVGEEPHLRDWSEVLIVTAAIYSLRAAILNRKRNVSILNNANLWVFGTLVVAEVRIRQLWITRILEDEANRFRANNAALQKEIRDLTTQNAALQQELVPLKEEVAKFGETELQLRREIAQLREATKQRGDQLEGFKRIVGELGEGVGDIDDASRKLAVHVREFTEQKRGLEEKEATVRAGLEKLVADRKEFLADRKALNAGAEQLKRDREALAAREEAVEAREKALE